MHLKAIHYILKVFHASFHMCYAPSHVLFYIGFWVFFGCQLAEFSSSSQRYVSLQYRRKDSDYINISEGKSDLITKKSCDIDYENVTEPQIAEPDEKNCDDGNISDSSDTSVESAVHYSKVVFPNVDK